MNVKRTASLLATAWLAFSPIGVLADQTGLVFVVEDEDSAVYLVGSIHVLRADDYPLPPAMDTAYKAADVLIMELDLDDLDPVADMVLVQETGMAPDGSSLKKLMGEDAWAQASDSAKQADVDLESLNALRPWLASLTVMQLELLQNGFVPKHGVEFHYLRRATEDGKAIEGLETSAQQLAIFNTMSNEQQVEMLLQTLAEIDGFSEELDRMLAAWKRGDGETLYDMLEVSYDDYPQLFDQLIEKRNRAWLAPLKQALAEEDQDYMVIVGSLHLLGTTGVVELLKQEGYSVKRL